MPCKHFDAGWCYAPEDAETTAEAGQCNRMPECPQSVSWPDSQLPPINLTNSQKAFDFYRNDDDNDQDI